MILKVNNITLPSPTSFDESREPIWSSNTGRVASGKMVGDIIAYKRTYNVAWGILTKNEYEKIKDATKASFFNVVIIDNNVTTTLTAYSSALSKSNMLLDGYYTGVSVNLIEQ